MLEQKRFRYYRCITSHPVLDDSGDPLAWEHLHRRVQQVKHKLCFTWVNENLIRQVRTNSTGVRSFEI